MRSASVAPLPFVLFAVASPCLAQDPPPHVGEFVERHCIECHGDGVVKAGLDLTETPEDEVGRLWRWSRMRERVVAHEMPPLHVAEVTEAERRRFSAWVDGELARRVPAVAIDPGDVTIRRLSRAQWRNTIEDLLGIVPDIRELPVDDLGYGFDSIGDALTFSTLHLEKYLTAAQAVAADVFHGEDPAHPVRRPFAASSMRPERERVVVVRGEVANLLSNTMIDCRVPLPRNGIYRLEIRAFGQQAGKQPARMRVLVDGDSIALIDVPNESPKEFVVEAPLPGGIRTIGLAFVNDHYDPRNADPSQRDRNLAIESLVVEGPVDERPMPAAQEWLHEAAERGDTAALRLRSLVQTALPRLWRGRGDAASRERLLRAAQARLEAGESEIEVRRFALAAALVSPWFLFRVEDPTGPVEDRREELATRLSYMLWASAPDDRLRRVARDGGLP